MRLLREYGDALERLVAVYERDPHEREDLMQEIAFALWRALPAYRRESSERTFVYRIAHNRAITHRFRARRRSYTIERENPERDVPDPMPDPLVRTEIADQRRKLLESVSQLSASLRQTVMLSLEGLSNAEIAEVLGATRATVAVRLTRARDALMTLMSGERSDE